MLERGQNTAVQRRSILIVDDESSIRQALRLTVQEIDSQAVIVESSDGADAFQRLGRQKFDALVLDLRMPKKDGHSVLENLARMDRRQRPDHILVLSAHINSGQPFVPPKGLGESLTSMSKPWPQDELECFLKKALKTGEKGAPTIKARVFGGLNRTVPQQRVTLQPTLTASSVVDLLANTAAAILAEKLKSETTRERAYSAQQEEPAGDISAVFPLESSKLSGSFGIALDRGCYRALGENVAAVAQLCQQIFAEARAKLNLAGFGMREVSPAVQIGEGHAMQHSCAGGRFVVRFRTDAGAFRVETIITQ